MSRFKVVKARFALDEQDLFEELGITHSGEDDFELDRFCLDLDRVIGCNPTQDDEATTVWLGEYKIMVEVPFAEFVSILKGA